MFPSFSTLPPWVIGAVIDLVEVIVKLFMAKDDAEREEALMSAAEALKARLDQRKFG